METPDASRISLKDLRPRGARTHCPRATAALADGIASTHRRLGLDAPALGALATRPWAFSGEQLGVEIRPATAFKLAALDALGTSCAAVFLVESRDVASKAPRLRFWNLPDASSPTLSRSVSPLAEVGKRRVEQLPLERVAVVRELPRARDALVEAYRATTARADWRRTLARIDDLVALLDASTRGSGSLADYGQRQTVAVARALGVGRVLFCDLRAIEEHLLADESFRGATSPDALARAGLLPAGDALFWGEHHGCGGRARVSVALDASCLRCRERLDRAQWTVGPLRATARMLGLRSFGADLFISGGTSPYNDDVARFCRARGEEHLPIAWRGGFGYGGSHQRASAEVARRSAEGGYSLLDAVINAPVDEGAEERPAVAALAQVGQRLRDELTRQGLWTRSVAARTEEATAC